MAGSLLDRLAWDRSRSAKAVVSVALVRSPITSGLILVSSMRARVWISVTFFLLLCLFPARMAPAANGPATVKYFDRASQIVLQGAAPEIRRHADAIARSGPVKLTYRVRANGTLERVRIISGDPNSFTARIFVNAIRSANFPPLPKAVLSEQGKKWVDIEASFESLDNIRR